MIFEVVPEWWAKIELRLETFRVGLKICDLLCGEVSKTLLTVMLSRRRFPKLRKINGCLREFGKMALNVVNYYF